MSKERIIYLFITILVGITAITLLRKEESVQTIQNKRYWIYKTFSEETYPVVLAGDSRIFRGLSPEVFEEVDPALKAVNLGYSSNGYHPEYLSFLDERLDRSANHPVIVLGISAHSFSRNGSGSYSYRAEKNRKKEEVMQYMKLYQLTKLFSPIPVLKAFGMESKNRFMTNYHMIYHFDGWMESYWDRRDTTNSIASYKVIFKDNQYSADAVGMLFRQVRKWSDEGINVVAFRSPTTYGIRHLEDSLSGFKVEPFKRELLENGAKWIEIDQQNYQTYDGNHLESESARKLSRDIALAIKEILEEE